MDLTKNYKLKKPSADDFADIGDLNENADTIDAQLKRNADDLEAANNAITSLQTSKADKTEIPTTLPANGGNAATVNGHTVAKDVPADAKFTDTTYTAATAAPKANGAAAVGTSVKYAREDHVHPQQTSVSGNAGTAAKLQTARKINGVAFDGSADITIKAEANGGNAATVNGHTVNADVPANAKFTDTTYTAATAAPKANGTAAVGTSVKYAREDHVHPQQTSVSGNAGTAAKLQTARKINGVAFDGTADITVTAVDSTARTAASNAQTTANGKFDKTGGTISGDVRIKNNTNYGAKLNFGELEYAYLHEDTDDHLKIYANNGIAIIGDNGVTIDTNETGLTIDGVKYSPLGVTPYMCGNVDLNSLGRDDPGCILFYNIDQAAYSITNGINGGGMRGWIIHADYSRGLFGVQFYMNYTGTMLYRRYYTYDSSKPYNRSFGEWVRLSWFS